MKKNFFLLIILNIAVITNLFGQDTKNTFGSPMKNSNFHLGLDIQTKYVWRGMEMMTEESTPVLFPQINYQYKGFYAYVIGGYSLNGKYSEVDLGISHTYKWLTLALNDYYYPTTTSGNDQYFEFSKGKTTHWLEGALTITPDKIPFHITFSNFFYGADKKSNGKQAYSTYIEIGTYYNFLNYNQIALTLGAACNESCYNNYEESFSICNIEFKYTHNLSFKNGWSLPLNVYYIINPFREKSFVNFSTSFAF